jgi:trehalose 6-phosphate phosphatase
VVDETLGRLRAERATAGIFTDFDGTLAPIVDDPAAARPLAGAPALLDQLAARYAVVGVLSGRPVAFLQQWLPPTLLLSGLYGLEAVRDGARTEHPEAAAWRAAIDDAAAAAPIEARVEHKGLSLTLHYRENPELGAAVVAFGEQQAARSGLLVRAARRSVELHPPIAVDKGTALLAAARDLSAVCFFGDDAGDLAAFAALDALGAKGATTVRIAVRSDESPPALLDAADVVVDGPEGVLAQLASLL